MRSFQNTIKGVSIVEIVIGSAILAAIFFASAGAINQVRELERSTTNIIRANYLLLEGVDVAKIFRDISWTNEIDTLTLNTQYYLIWDSTEWVATTTQTVIDGLFYRTIEFDLISRDGNDNIVSSGGVVDTGTRKLTSTVSWNDRNGTTTKTFETYITDLYAN